jgi:hypothetical protein
MDCPYALLASSLVSPKLAKAEQALSNKISSETEAKDMSLSALFCVNHFCDPDQDRSQDLGTNGFNKMGSKTSALAFSHIRLTATSAYGDGLLRAPPPSSNCRKRSQPFPSGGWRSFNNKSNRVLRQSKVASFFWLLLLLQSTMPGAGTRASIRQDRLLFEHFSHFFRTLSELFLKLANQLVILAF